MLELRPPTAGLSLQYVAGRSPGSRGAYAEERPAIKVTFPCRGTVDLTFSRLPLRGQHRTGSAD